MSTLRNTISLGIEESRLPIITEMCELVPNFPETAIIQ